MAREFKEVAHLKTDANKYGENYDRIFGKKEKVHTEDCSILVNVRHGCNCNGHQEENDQESK